MAFEERDVPRRRRRPALAIALLFLLFGLLTAVAVLVDNGLRAAAEERVGTEIRAALSLPADAPLDIEIGGLSMILQLLTGSIEEVTIESSSVTLGGLTGPARLAASGVPVDLSAPAESVELAFGATEQSLTEISANLSGLPITSVAIEGEQIAVSAQFEALFVSLPLAVGLSPAAVDGQIAFTPTSIRLGEAEFDADDLRSRFGAIAERALQTQNVCVAQYLPAALALESVRLADPRMVLTFTGTDVALDEASLSVLGSCD